MNLKIIAIDFHRNGVCGAPFDVVLFEDDSECRKVAIVFERTGHCAVLAVDKLAAGDIAFGSNSWRGDHFESDLRKEIANQRHDNEWRARPESEPIPKVHRSEKRADSRLSIK